MKQIPPSPYAKPVTLVGLIILLIALLNYFFSDKPGDNAEVTEITSDNSKPAEIAANDSSSHTDNNHISDENSQPVSAEPVEPQPQDIRYTVKDGDSLETIFNQLNIPINTLYNILEADEAYLDADVLHPDQQLIFTLDKEHNLSELALVVDPKKTVIYQRSDDNTFIHDEKLTPTSWQTEVLKGTIEGSFYLSAVDAGLTDKTIMTVRKLLQSKINFRRDLRAGDEFQVVMERETIDDTPIGNNTVVAIRFNGKKVDLSAYLHTDGIYYDKNGENLTPALLRYPTEKRFRISSSFNPRRLNPVTKRISPHNGVDFATPVGTKVISTGDGVVLRVATHRYAGKYVVIKEFGAFSTRYLHLSKILVRKGQKVSRGQVIALSGNTGRSTGPHLHYELHINDKPVNPITAKIPMLKSIPKTEMAVYQKHIKNLDDLMSGEAIVTAGGIDWLNEWLMRDKQAEKTSTM